MTTQINAEQRRVLVRFAAGQDAALIARGMNLDAMIVRDLIDRLAGSDGERARQLVADYDQRASLVAAATGSPRRTLAEATWGAERPNGLVSRAAPAGAAEPAASGSSPNSTVEQLLNAAGASTRRRTRALGDKVCELVCELRARLAAEVAEAAAEARVAQLRDELAAAESRLKQVRRPASQVLSAPSLASSAPTGVDRVDVNRAVRVWAAERGIEVNPRGVVRRELVEQWRAETGRAA